MERIYLAGIVVPAPITSRPSGGNSLSFTDGATVVFEVLLKQLRMLLPVKSRFFNVGRAFRKNEITIESYEYQARECHASPRILTSDVSFAIKNNPKVASALKGTPHDFPNNGCRYYRRVGFFDSISIKPGHYWSGRDPKVSGERKALPTILEEKGGLTPSKSVTNSFLTLLTGVTNVLLLFLMKK